MEPAAGNEGSRAHAIAGAITVVVAPLRFQHLVSLRWLLGSVSLTDRMSLGSPMATTKGRGHGVAGAAPDIPVLARFWSNPTATPGQRRAKPAMISASHPIGGPG